MILLFSVKSYSQKNTEKFRDFKADGFYHSINLSANLKMGNEEFYKYQGDYRIDLYQPNFITYLVGNIEYKEGNRSLITNKGFAHWRLILNKDKFAEPEIFSQIEYNDFISLKERFVGGGGLRINPFNKSASDSIHKITVEFGIGFMYEYEEVADTAKPLTKYIRSTNFLSLRYTFQDNVNIFSVTYFQPYLGNISDFRLLHESRFSVSINKFLAFFVSGIYRFDNEPPTGLKKYDFELQNGITINF
ncbi:MAG: DUF481 domain-containing protein [Candidatus Kapabacteria bacterium]|nr:DUF481 domain-containing protein [Ignavibacteriota bacterium]MCW5885290.1 DUF481 domain-containing protein [Candidatus Kapabacteria bacterium]